MANVPTTKAIASASSASTDMARKNAAAVIANSIQRQITAAWMLLRTAERFPTCEEPHDRFIRSSARVLRHAESQMWIVPLEDSDLVRLAANVEGLWFAIDAMS